MVQVIDRPPDIYDTLAGLLGETGKGFGAGIQTSIKDFFEEKKGERQEQQIQKQIKGLKDQGYSEQEARLNVLLTPGGQTELAKSVLERMTRGEGGVPGVGEPPPQEIQPGEERLTAAERVRHREAKAKREFERVKPILARADERAEQMTQKESSLNLMEDAVATGDLGYFSPDSLAELTGIEALRTPKGAQFISSGKEFFLGSIKRAGPRPNIFIEKQIAKMLPKIGRTREANLTVMEALRSELNVEREYQDILNRIGAEDETKLGYVKGDIGYRVNKELRDFAEREQDDLEQRLRDIEGAPKTKALRKVESGTKLSADDARQLLEKAGGDKDKARRLAQQLGYEF